jgi:hypothetical protein
MEGLRTFTYWFVGINIIAGSIFMFIACIFGGRDLFNMLRDLKKSEIDETDDGRVSSEE